MEEDILKLISGQGKKLDDIYRSVEQTRKYFLWTLIITAALFVLPLIGLMLVIPQFLSNYGAAGGMMQLIQ
jgi:hypothetical protein